jgi:hypothetical protein
MQIEEKNIEKSETNIRYLNELIKNGEAYREVLTWESNWEKITEALKLFLDQSFGKGKKNLSDCKLSVLHFSNCQNPRYEWILDVPDSETKNRFITINVTNLSFYFPKVCSTNISNFSNTFLFFLLQNDKVFYKEVITSITPYL